MKNPFPVFSILPAGRHLTESDLTRLAARDLSPRREKEARQHLATCPHCRNEWETLSTFWQSAAFTPPPSSFPVPDPRSERIYAAFTSSSGAPEKRTIMPVLSAALSTVSTRLMARPVLRASLAATAVVAGAAGVIVFGSALLMRAPRAVAFSDVEAAMAGIQNATWTTTVTRTIPGAALGTTAAIEPSLATTATTRVKKRQSESFMSASPPRLAVYGPLEARPTSNHPSVCSVPRGSKTIYSGKYVLSVSADGREYTKFDVQTLNRKNLASTEDIVRYSVLFPREQSEARVASQNERSPLSDEVLSVTTETPWTSTTDTLEGKAVVRLQNRTVHDYPVTKFRTKAAQEVEENTIWVDPKTHRILRRETHIPPFAGSSADTRIVFDNYRYNGTLPSGVFDVPIPAVGKPFLFNDYTKAGIQSGRVSARDTAKIKAAIEQASRLWNQKQADKFVAACDFDFKDRWAGLRGGKSRTPLQIAENKRHWRKRAENGIPYQTWQVQKATVSAWLVRGVFVREKPSDPFPPTGRRLNYLATCTVLAQLRPGAAPVRCSLTVGLHRVGKGFRIIDLRMYDRRAL